MDSTSLAHVFSINELLIQILENLDFRDLLVLQGVNSIWKDVISSVHSLQELTWKGAVIPTEPNPHFNEAETFREHTTTPDSLIFSSACNKTKVSLLEGTPTRESWDSFWATARRTRDALIYLSINEVEHICPVCYLGSHPRFRYEDLHPALRCLEGEVMCFLGYGTYFFIYMSDRRHYTNDFDDVFCQPSKQLCKQLETIYRKMQKYHLFDDMFVRPICTRLLVAVDHEPARKIGMATRNDDGITLSQAVTLIAKACYQSLLLRKKNTIQHLEGRLDDDRSGPAQRYLREVRETLRSLEIFNFD